MQMAMENANSTLAPIASQMPPAMTAIVMTAGTKMPAILSAVRAIGAFEALASSTRRIIWLIVVSSPTRSARKWMEPCLLIVADQSISRLLLHRDRLTRDGRLVDARRAGEHCASAGMRSPGRTMISSPARVLPRGWSAPRRRARHRPASARGP